MGMINTIKKLYKMAKKLKIRDCLDNRASKHINTTVEILTKPQTDHAFKVYQEFLHNVLRHYSPRLVILYITSLGKQRIASITEEDKVSFFNYVKESKDSFSSLTFKALAKDYKIPYLDSA